MESTRTGWLFGVSNPHVWQSLLCELDSGDRVIEWFKEETSVLRAPCTRRARAGQNRDCETKLRQIGHVSGLTTRI